MVVRVVVGQVAGVQVVANQVVGTQVVDQVAGAQIVDQLAGVQVVVDLVAGTQVHYGSSGTNRSDGCSDIGVIQTDIGLVCDISALSDNQKVELLLNHFTPGDGYEFAHETVQKGAKKWKLTFQRAWLTELEWLVYSL